MFPLHSRAAYPSRSVLLWVAMSFRYQVYVFLPSLGRHSWMAHVCDVQGTNNAVKTARRMQELFYVDERIANLTK